MIYEENYSYGDESNNDQMSKPVEQLGTFDKFGNFNYNKFEDEWHMTHQPKRKTIDLKNLSKENFNDLLAAKNQDKRFYSWLHLHPLFDEEVWDDDRQEKRKNRRASEQINTIQPLLMAEKESSEEDSELFYQLYAGVSSLFQVEEEKENEGYRFMK